MIANYPNWLISVLVWHSLQIRSPFVAFFKISEQQTKTNIYLIFVKKCYPQSRTIVSNLPMVVIRNQKS